MGDILSMIRDQWGDEPIMQVPPFVFSGYCACCGKKIELNKYESEIYNDERWCDECRSEYADYENRQDFPNQWDKTPAEFTLYTDERFLQMRPQDIVIPQDDILKVTFAKNHQLFIRLHS